MPKYPAAIFKLACLGALVLTVLAYLPGLPGDFIFDDFGSIISNPAVTASHHGFVEWFRALFMAPVGGLLRPISMLSFILNAQFTGISPLGFKLTNISIHLVCGMLLGLVARELLQSYRKRMVSRLDERAIDWLSLTVATLWLVHPLNLTAVLYIVQRETSLAALFSAAAVLCYLHSRRQGLERRTGRLLMWIATPLFIMTGMLCKETAVLTPVFLLVIEYTILHGKDEEGRPVRQIHAFFLIFLALPLLAALALAADKPGFFFAGYAGRDFTMYDRILSESRIMLDYLRWIFVPDLRQLALFHDDFTVSRGLLDPPTTLPSLLLILGLLVLAWHRRRRNPLLSFGILWFFAGHLLESTILPLELVFEHRNYLPLFGVILACVGLLYEITPAPNRQFMAVMLPAVCLLLATVTAVRAMDWHTELDFARSESRHHPASPRAVTELQWAYMNYVMVTRDERAIPATVEAADHAKRLDPGSINQDVGLAYMYASIGKLPEAAERLHMAAARAPFAKPTATFQLALQSLILLAKPEFEPIHKDIRAVYEAAASNPAMGPSPCFYANVLNTYALFLRDSDRVQEALASMHKAVVLCPVNPQLHYNMANMLLSFGDTRDAKPEIDALRSIAGFRYQGDLAILEAEYARQTSVTQH